MVTTPQKISERLTYDVEEKNINFLIKIKENGIITKEQLREAVKNITKDLTIYAVKTTFERDFMHKGRTIGTISGMISSAFFRTNNPKYKNRQDIKEALKELRSELVQYGLEKIKRDVESGKFGKEITKGVGAGKTLGLSQTLNHSVIISRAKEFLQVDQESIRKKIINDEYVFAHDGTKETLIRVRQYRIVETFASKILEKDTKTGKYMHDLKEIAKEAVVYVRENAAEEKAKVLAGKTKYAKNYGSVKSITAEEWNKIFILYREGKQKVFDEVGSRVYH